MTTLQEAGDRANDASAKTGIKLTPKRKQVFTLLLASKTPLSAYEIADQYHQSFEQPIPVMSIYRMLDFLTENNLAHKLSSENKFISCSHSTCSHSHQVPQFLICEQCHQVKEVGIEQGVFESLKGTVEKAGYVIEQTQLELKCLCVECAKAK